jgi:hypothetical protein
MFKDFGVWILAVAKEYWGWLPSSAVATVIGLIANAEGLTLPRYVYAGIVTLGFLYSFFAVWRKEYVANRHAPQLTVDWLSSSKSSNYNSDTVTIRNTGSTPATAVQLDKFSREGITWHRRPEIQTIQAQQSISFLPEFSVEIGPHSHEIGYMRYVLAKEPVSVLLLWSDTNGTRFKRSLKLGFTEDKLNIRVEYGRISARRD